MKKKAVYRKKLTRALKSAFRNIKTAKSYTVDEACDRIRKLSKKYTR
jgi:hypothetical protein